MSLQTPGSGGTVIVDSAELGIPTPPGVLYLYYKHLLQEGFPFVEIKGLDLLNTEQVSQATRLLKQDILEHALLLFRFNTTEKPPVIKLKEFYSMLLLPGAVPSSATTTLGDFWHNIFPDFERDSFLDVLFPLSIWNAQLLPTHFLEFNLRGRDFKFIHPPTLLKEMKANDPQLYLSVKNCEVYGTHLITKKETLFMNRNYTGMDYWPKKCSCCSFLDRYFLPRYYRHEWQLYDVIIGDNNQLIHFQPPESTWRDGKSAIRGFFSSDWWEGNLFPQNEKEITQEGECQGQGQSRGEGQGQDENQGRGEGECRGEGEGQDQVQGEGQGQGQDQDEDRGRGDGEVQGEDQGQGDGEVQGEDQGRGDGEVQGEDQGQGDGEGQGEVREDQGDGQDQGQGEGQGDSQHEGRSQYGGEDQVQVQGQVQGQGQAECESEAEYEETKPVSYRKKRLHPDFPFVEIIGLDAFADNNTLRKLSPKLRADLVEHGALLFHSPRSVPLEVLNNFFMEGFLFPGALHPEFIQIEAGTHRSDFEIIGGYWHNDFPWKPMAGESLDGYLLTLSLWYMRQLPTLDPRAGDTLLSHTKVIIEKIKSENPGLYEELKKCEIYGKNNLTGAETFFIHRGADIGDCWPNDCSCCDRVEDFLNKHFFVVPWKNFDFVIGDNNQIVHHAPRTSRKRDGHRILWKLESWEWWPGKKTSKERKNETVTEKEDL